jgi:hypothetical protein
MCVCGICGTTDRWGKSRSGYLICMICHPDPCQALEIFARRVPGGVKQVQSWRLEEPISPKRAQNG